MVVIFTPMENDVISLLLSSSPLSSHFIISLNTLELLVKLHSNKFACSIELKILHVLVGEKKLTGNQRFFLENDDEFGKNTDDTIGNC